MRLVHQSKATHDPAPSVVGGINHANAGTTHQLQLKLLTVEVKLSAPDSVADRIDFSADGELGLLVYNLGGDVVLDHQVFYFDSFCQTKSY
jgi:hypothetical protein